MDDDPLQHPRPASKSREESLEAIRNLALRSYLDLKIGTREEFEAMWQEAFFADESKRTEN